MAAAVAAKTRLLPNQKRDLEFVLAWDMPVVEFGSGKGVKYCRFCWVILLGTVNLIYVCTTPFYRSPFLC